MLSVDRRRCVCLSFVDWRRNSMYGGATIQPGQNASAKEVGERKEKKATGREEKRKRREEGTRGVDSGWVIV